MENKLEIECQEQDFIGLSSYVYFNEQQYKLFDKINDYETMKEYLQNAIDMESVDALFYMGHFCEEKDDYENMLSYYKKAAESNHLDAIYNLAYYYKEKKDHGEQIKWLMKGIELKDPDCMCDLARCYEKIGIDDNVKKYYTMAIDLHYLKAYYDLGLWYSKNESRYEMARHFIFAINAYTMNKHLKNKEHKNIPIDENNNIDLVKKMMVQVGNYYDDDLSDTKNAIKYYKMAAEKNSIESLYNLGRIYYEKMEYEKMEKYLLIGIDLKDIDCMYELAIYYQNINDFDNMKKYYLMALSEKTNTPHQKKSVNDGEIDFNLFKVKHILETIEEPSIVVKEKLKTIRSKKEIMIFENKKKLFTQLNNIIECGICYEVKLNIDLNCGHCCCEDCYPRLYNKSCPFCRL